MKKSYLWLLGLLLISISGCASSRPIENVALRTLVPVHAVTLTDEQFQPLAVSEQNETDAKNLDILAISGGGSNGAYGAGIIYGWTKSGKRPEFDVVTGVSTGALIAILAFAGPEYDEQLKELYTHQTNQTIYKKKGQIAGFFSDSFYDYTPFKNQITKIVNAKLLDKVAEEYRKGRRLFIATTNLDAGKLVIWDIGRLAASNRHNKVLRSQKIIRASATVPGFFKPVYIKPRNGIEIRQAHVDGGVKAPVLVRGFMFDRPAKKKNLYVIINSQMKDVDAAKPVKPDVSSISTKAISELLRGLTEKTVYQCYVKARNAKANFNMTRIPDNADPIEFPLNFEQDKMKKLFALGEQFGMSQNGWEHEPPMLDAHGRIASNN